MSLPKICTCPTVPAADCPFHHQDACGSLAAMPCSPVLSNTPETDSALCISRHPNDILGWPEGRKATFGLDHIVTADFARRMERERDDARATVIDVLSALGALEHEGPRLAAMRVMDERDTARVVAVDAIRELDRILDTGDTYASREIVQNLKDSLRGSSLENANVLPQPKQSTSPNRHE